VVSWQLHRMYVVLDRLAHLLVECTVRLSLTFVNMPDCCSALSRVRKGQESTPWRRGGIYLSISDDKPKEERILGVEDRNDVGRIGYFIIDERYHVAFEEQWRYGVCVSFNGYLAIFDLSVDQSSHRLTTPLELLCTYTLQAVFHQLSSAFQHLDAFLTGDAISCATSTSVHIAQYWDILSTNSIQLL
jgi:hypothetical protein